MARLRAATAVVHRRLERRMPLFEKSFGPTDYMRLLQAFWGFYQPTEQNLNKVPGLTKQLPDWQTRSKLAWLREDLEHLGLSEEDVSQLPICAAVPAIPNITAALGCLYVIEGATLGGAVIAAHLQRTLGLGPHSGARFFSSYELARDAKWQLFSTCVTQWFDNHPGMALTELTDSAQETFECLEAWLRRTGQLRED